MSNPILTSALTVLPLASGETEREKWQNLKAAYPWFALPWLAMAQLEDSVTARQKAALFITDNFRLHWLLNQREDETGEKNRQESGHAQNAGAHEAALQTAEIALKEDAAEDKPQHYALDLTEEQRNETATDQDSLPPAGHVLALAETDILPEAVEFPEAEALTGVDGLPQGEAVPEAEAIAGVETEAVIERGDADAMAQSPDLKQGERDFREAALQPSAPPLSHREAVSEGVLRAGTSHSNEPLFTPFHLVDYFASQGIKIDISDIPRTQLDKKIMSFTQWLKIMKRVNFDPQAAGFEPNAAIDPHASASVEKGDVITEAMAYVLEQQGNKSEATKVYLKLILLHPEKSALFASRIYELNK